jgi:hypothetical protein
MRYASAFARTRSAPPQVRQIPPSATFACAEHLSPLRPGGSSASQGGCRTNWTGSQPTLAAMLSRWSRRRGTLSQRAMPNCQRDRSADLRGANAGPVVMCPRRSGGSCLPAAAVPIQGAAQLHCVNITVAWRDTPSGPDRSGLSHHVHHSVAARPEQPRDDDADGRANGRAGGCPAYRSGQR